MSIKKDNLRKKFWLRLRPIQKQFKRMTSNAGVSRSDWGGLRTITPISRNFGFDRGTPIDRYYIEKFVGDHASDIRGEVMEVGTNMYTLRYGANRVVGSEVTHHDSGNPRATLVLDLTNAEGISEQRFDCIICTQTMQFIYDVQTATANLFRLLRPGGVLLFTCPGISQISQPDMRSTGEFWRFTEASIMRLLRESFPEKECMVRTYGNVVSSIAFLHGLSAEELTRDELETNDDDFQMIVAARAVRRH